MIAVVGDASFLVDALTLRDGGAARRLDEVEVHAPHLVDVEVLHALRSLARAGAVEHAIAASARAALVEAVAERYGILSLLERVWELRENLTTHDAAYVALAEVLDVPLVTGDARLARAPGPRCPVEVVA